jgi:hypothetical protein
VTSLSALKGGKNSLGNQFWKRFNDLHELSGKTLLIFAVSDFFLPLSALLSRREDSTASSELHVCRQRRYSEKRSAILSSLDVNFCLCYQLLRGCRREMNKFGFLIAQVLCIAALAPALLSQASRARKDSKRCLVMHDFP